MNKTDLLISIKEVLRQEFPKATEYQLSKVTDRLLYHVHIFVSVEKNALETKCMLASFGKQKSSNEVEK